MEEETFTKREQAKLDKLGFSANASLNNDSSWTIFLCCANVKFYDEIIAVGKGYTRSDALKSAIELAQQSDKCACGGALSFRYNMCVICGNTKKEPFKYDKVDSQIFEAITYLKASREKLKNNNIIWPQTGLKRAIELAQNAIKELESANG